MQNSHYVQVLRSPISAALLHGTIAAGVSQILRRGTSNRITKPSKKASPIFGWAAMTLCISPYCSLLLICYKFTAKSAGENYFENRLAFDKVRIEHRSIAAACFGHGVHKVPTQMTIINPASRVSHGLSAFSTGHSQT